MVAGFVVLALNAAAAAWGGFAWWRSDPSVGFWYVLRAAQAAVVVQSVLGGVLVASGEDAPDGLHLFSGVTPLFISLVSEGMRVSAAQLELEGVEDVDALERREQVLIARRVVLREMAIMTVGALMIVTLTLRASGIF